MGLIVNKPAEDLTVADLLKQLDIRTGPALPTTPVHFGGPVEHARGFVLHSAEYHRPDSTLRVSGDFAMTATLDILEDIALGHGPDRTILALGYSGWGPGQLEGEIGRNGWLTADADSDVIFAGDNGVKWTAALNSLGVDPTSLSGTAGRA